ncbi:DUF4097 family beta strand repeat-containing protein [Nocardia sp. NPDC127526]|uniref:DUF4097 family beta strand repeat-containing protein n=1 Tax=Nocardia sp. NPDC127526 TaxID=3345393 RepID=UPI003624F5DA
MPTFQTPDPITLTVEVLSGNVTVIASDRTDTVVEVRPANPAKKDSVRAAEQTQVNFTGGHLAVTTPKGWRTYSPFSGNPSVDVTIEVPTASRLNATTALGRLLGRGELGECTLAVSSGDIIVEQALDSVTATTAQGDIRIGEATRGTLRLETSMGELEIGIHPGSAARLQTNTLHGNVQNITHPVPQDTKNTVEVYARNSYGNIIIRPATAA